jgi:hypothetical protein
MSPIVACFIKQGSPEAMVSPTVYFSLTKNFFARNNVMEGLCLSVVQGVYNLITLRSRMKLLKYRYMLETHKLQRIEETLTKASVYDMAGSKMNRSY